MTGAPRLSPRAADDIPDSDFDGSVSVARSVRPRVAPSHVRTPCLDALDAAFALADDDGSRTVASELSTGSLSLGAPPSAPRASRMSRGCADDDDDAHSLESLATALRDEASLRYQPLGQHSLEVFTRSREQLPKRGGRVRGAISSDGAKHALAYYVDRESRPAAKPWNAQWPIHYPSGIAPRGQKFVKPLTSSKIS